MFIRIREDGSIALNQSGSTLLGSFFSLFLGMTFSSQEAFIYIIILLGVYFYEIYLYFSQNNSSFISFHLLLECMLLITSTKGGMMIHGYL